MNNNKINNNSKKIYSNNKFINYNSNNINNNNIHNNRLGFNINKNVNKLFRIHDNEVYIIKENNMRRANEIIKKSAFVKPFNTHLKINCNNENNNKDLAASFKETRDLWSTIHNINNVNEYFIDKMDMKFE